MIRMTLFFFLFFCYLSYGQERTLPTTQPQELGKVAWCRDYAQALMLSKNQGKPIFLLFQEVPGCLTCRNYGKGVLSNTIIVDAIESYFIPLAVFNNKGGKDAAILRRYGEPSWNNPVVRIVDQNGQDLIKRIAGDYSATKVAQEMIFVLEEQRESVPIQLRDLAKGLFY